MILDHSADQPMRVVFVTKMPSPYMVEFFNELVRAGECRPYVIYLTAAISDRPWDQLPIEHEHLILNSSLWNERWREGLSRLMAAPLVVFSYYTHPFCIWALYRRWLAKLPFVYWGERPGFFQLGWVGRMMRRVMLFPLHQSGAPIWGIGQFGIEGYKKEFGESRPYVNLPYSSDLSAYLKIERPRKGQPTERRFLFSGAFIHRKGVIPLAKAFVVLAKENAGVKLILMGDGPLRGEMEAILNPVADRVTWKGFTAWKELPNGYAEGDILCLPSAYDGWGMVVVEGLAAGVPVIATHRVGAALEAVVDERTGWRVNVNDVPALVNAMRKAMVATPDQLAEMASHGRSAVLRHDVREAAPAFLNAANDALNSSPIRWAKQSQIGRIKEVLLVANYTPDHQLSMQRYADLIEKGLADCAVPTRVVRPMNLAGQLTFLPKVFGKLLGYVDKFILFPLYLRWAARRCAKKGGLVHLLDQGNGVYLYALRDLPHVVTCHDLIAVKASTENAMNRYHSPAAKRSLYQKVNLRALRRASFLICVSEATRRDCIQYLQVPEKRCDVVYNPIDPFFLEADSRLVLPEFPEQFLLHVGNAGWYKNRLGLLHMYQAMRQLGCDIPLVLMGGALSEEERALVGKLDIGVHVVSVTFPDDSVIRAAYARAKALIFPSWDEGFGWPIVEALAQGCQVFTTDQAPMTEAGGSVGFYFDPARPEVAAKVIMENLESGERKASDEVERKAHAATFTMKRFIDKCTAAYLRVLAEQHAN